MAEENGSDQVGGRKVVKLLCDPCKYKDLTSAVDFHCKNCDKYLCKD